MKLFVIIFLGWLLLMSFILNKWGDQIEAACRQFFATSDEPKKVKVRRRGKHWCPRLQEFKPSSCPVLGGMVCEGNMLCISKPTFGPKEIVFTDRCTSVPSDYDEVETLYADDKPYETVAVKRLSDAALCYGTTVKQFADTMNATLTWYSDAGSNRHHIELYEGEELMEAYEIPYNKARELPCQVFGGQGCRSPGTKYCNQCDLLKPFKVDFSKQSPDLLCYTCDECKKLFAEPAYASSPGGSVDSECPYCGSWNFKYHKQDYKQTPDLPVDQWLQ